MNTMEQPAGNPPGQGQRRGQQAVFGVVTTMPPPVDPLMTLPRADEVTGVMRLLSDEQTGAVMLIGAPGSGKSTLAALVFQRLLQEKQAGRFLARYMVWLGLDSYTTLPDMIAAILGAVNVKEPGFALMKPEQQISALLRALRRAQEPALIVLDQFESLLYPDASQGTADRGALRLFLEMLQTDLGASRIILTSPTFPYDEQQSVGTRVRPHQVSGLTVSEGIELLQGYGVQGAAEELANVWQRCGGHVFSLVFFSALVQLSETPTNYLLTSPDYQAMWTGNITAQLMKAVYHFLTPVQYVLLRTLCLFSEPAPIAGLVAAITGASAAPGSPQYAIVEREMGALVQLSLVQTVLGSSQGPCFTVHPVLRLYIIEHYLDGVETLLADGYAALRVSPPQIPLGRPDALQVALAMGHMQVASYYRQVVQDHYIPREKRRSALDVEPIIAAIRHLCLGRYWQPASDILFAEGLHEDMVQWGAWNVLIGLYLALLPPLGVLQPRDQGLVASHIATLYGRLDEVQQSTVYFEQALAIQRQVGDLPSEIATLTNRGELLRLHSEMDQARANFEQALRLNEKVQSIRLQCILLHNLGLLYHGQKNYQLALKCYRESLKLAYGPQVEKHRGMILTNLGMLLYEQGAHQDGLSILLYALQLRQAQGDPTALLLEVFLKAVEQKMGVEAFTILCQQAVQNQQQALARYSSPEMQTA